MLELTNDWDNRVVQHVSLTGGAGTTDFSSSLGEFAFRDIVIGNSSCLQSVLRAYGAITDTITNLQISGSPAFALGQPVPQFIHAASPDTIRVCYAPTAVGADTGLLTVTTAPCGHTFVLPLRGNGVTQSDVAAQIDDVPSVALLQHYPNPFTEESSIGFTVTSTERCVLTVEDLFGRERLRVCDRIFAPGSYSERIDARSLAAGTYIAVLHTSRGTLRRAISVVR